MSSKSPVREYRTILQDSGSDANYINRLLVATPATGLVRIEWAMARYGQIIPVNWAMVQVLEYVDSFIPLRYEVADAQNLIVKMLVEKDFEWLLLIEHDTMPPPDGFVRINEYIREAKIPIVSGLYYTKSIPSEPLLFRGRGNSFYGDWKLGDKVWVDGIPTGFVLIHGGILRAMWAESAEYTVRGQITRRVFDTPRHLWYDPQTGVHVSRVGTSDLEWCDRVMNGGYFEKAGWKEYQKKKYPFLCDTGIFCRHIDVSGRQFPP